MFRQAECGKHNSLDTEREILVKSILLLSIVRESDVVESDNRRRELLDIFEVEKEILGFVYGLDETSSLHLVDNLLLRLGLLDQIGVGTGGSDETERNEIESVSELIEEEAKRTTHSLMCLISSCCFW